MLTLIVHRIYEDIVHNCKFSITKIVLICINVILIFQKLYTVLRLEHIFLFMFYVVRNRGVTLLLYK
jgi:hypothetical protein